MAVLRFLLVAVALAFAYGAAVQPQVQGSSLEVATGLKAPFRSLLGRHADSSRRDSSRRDGEEEEEWEFMPDGSLYGLCSADVCCSEGMCYGETYEGVEYSMCILEEDAVYLADEGYEIYTIDCAVESDRFKDVRGNFRDRNTRYGALTRFSRDRRDRTTRYDTRFNRQDRITHQNAARTRDNAGRHWRP